MQTSITINDKEYDLVITYKNNKNMYLRVKEDLKIHITCNKYVSNILISKFVLDNKDMILENIKRYENKQITNENYLIYQGKKYEIVYITKNQIIFTNNKVFINRSFNKDNFYKKQAKLIYLQRLNNIYNQIEEDIPYPALKIRNMKTRWGVCNVKTKTITLNLELIKMPEKYLDYVIIHELCHLKHPNHSKDFWNMVSKYEPLYKKIRKEMKNVI